MPEEENITSELTRNGEGSETEMSVSFVFFLLVVIVFLSGVVSAISGGVNWGRVATFFSGSMMCSAFFYWRAKTKEKRHLLSTIVREASELTAPGYLDFAVVVLRRRVHGFFLRTISRFKKIEKEWARFGREVVSFQQPAYGPQRH